MQKAKICIMILFFFGFSSNVLYSWDNERTHLDLSEMAARKSVLGLPQNYLKNLGFIKGLDEKTNGKEAFKWIRDGAYFEDAGNWWNAIMASARSNNHFHNPLKPWVEAGLSDVQTGESSVLWAQDSNQQNFLVGDWSWLKIKNYFYLALISLTDMDRQTNLAKTFRGLGHQMHLVQDTGQPDHVRNDAHPMDAIMGRNQYGDLYFEKWAKTNSDFIISIATSTTFPPIYPNVAMNVSNSNLAPITQFIDTDSYVLGGSPSTSNAQGLAEYTNANFLSDDTIFTEHRPTDDKHYFPFPRKTSTNIQELQNQNLLPETIISQDGVAELSFYIKKNADGEPIEHFVKPTYLTNNMYDTIGGGYLYERTFYRDEKCHEDYAQKLIPRAVGYSAGLLNYFFRGSIEINLPSTGIYSSATGTSTGFTRISLAARNTTSTEEDMNAGTIQLVIRYKLAHNDPFQSQPVETDDEFTYTVVSEVNNVSAIPKYSPVELVFDLSSNPIPFWATDVYLQVVYNGRLGSEDSAVAVGFKDISEPTPVDLYNNMDRICLNGNWYITESSDAINQAPLGWDIYTHNIQDGYLKIAAASDAAYASPSNYTFSLGTMLPGTLYRSYILSDYDYSFSYSDYTPVVATTSEDTADHSKAILTGHIVGSAIKNQVDYHVTDQAACDEIGETAPCDILTYPLLYPFRGTMMWGPAGFIVDNPKYPDNTNCAWELVQ